MARIPRCKTAHCELLPYQMGLCRKHFEEQEAKQALRRAALTLLHEGLHDGELLTDDGLREELQEIQHKWFLVCDVLRFNFNDAAMPKEEADSALEWCVSLASEIILAQRALDKGETPSSDLATTKEWVWKRLKHLEAGLMSNGLPRR